MDLFEDSRVGFGQPLSLENRSSTTGSLRLVNLSTNILSESRGAHRIVVVNLWNWHKKLYNLIKEYKTYRFATIELYSTFEVHEEVFGWLVPI